MRTVLNMLKAVEKLQMTPLQQGAMNSSTGKLVDLQKDQLFDGIRSDARDIQPPYAPLTIDIKKDKGQPTDRVTLKDQGDFYNGIFASPASDGLEIESRDSKSSMLKEKYGDEIFGLSNRNDRRTEWLEEVQDKFLEGVNKALK